jgi:hypothetical protein
VERRTGGWPVVCLRVGGGGERWEIGEGDDKNLKNTDIMGPLALELNVKVTLLDGWSTHALYSRVGHLVERTLYNHCGCP